MILKIVNKDQLCAIIIKNSYDKPGVSFCTNDDNSMQLAFMKHPSGKVIDSHFHNPIPREVLYTYEILHIKKGRMRVDFFDNQQVYIESHLLETGDTIMLLAGGHGFEVLEEIEMIEIKQGPYYGEIDKTRFSAKVSENIKMVSYPAQLKN